MGKQKYFLIVVFVILSIAITVHGGNFSERKDIPERVLLGLNDSELQDKDIPDFGPEVFEKLKKDPKVIETRGIIPKYATDKERRSWLDKLDKIRIGIRDNMLPYIHPNGTVISSGFDWEGFFYVDFYENATVNASLVDEIYGIIDKEAKTIGIQEVPVAFKLAAPPILTMTVYENRSVTPPQNRNTSQAGEAPNKSVSGFELFGGLVSILLVWLFVRQQ
ncbi:MAG: hypothetical protein O8C62_11200 [Candidatus Methanoperedens sp.]|nr:hypothetical protein [Candidatus Methanoperedens sp.]